MKRLPLGISTFRKIREQDYLYIDKTQDIYNLITKNDYIFLSRPRRFGKSLLASTLEEIFLGNKELFKNLWIYTSDYQWDKFPVIKLDFSTLNTLSSDNFEISLSREIDRISESHNIETSKYSSPIDKINILISKLGNAKRVVIIIDEYDNPILSNLQNMQKAESIKDILRVFFATIKGLDAYIHKFFITGVTKIAKVSVFSGLNNLNDISINHEYSSILGYTKEEIDRNFKEYIQDTAFKLKLDIKELNEQIKCHYNGYCFAENFVKIYNPFSILYFLHNQKFANYWFSSATPSFLITLAKNQLNSIEELNNINEIKLSEAGLSAFDLENIPLYTALFQTGYLTITDYNPVNKLYTLSYPNLEVENSFKEYILATLTNTNVAVISNSISLMYDAIKSNNLSLFFKELKVLLADIPYQLYIQKEAYYHTIMQLIARFLGFNVCAEVSTNVGRIDLVILTEKYVYIFEFKLNSDASTALNQILDKKYYERYLNLNKQIILVGSSFEYTRHGLVIDWEEQTLN